MPPKTERFELRMDEDILSRIDKWRGEQDEIPTRADAVRRLVEAGLTRSSPDTVRLSDGEKLILSMLSALTKHFKINEEQEDNADLLDAALSGGHFWALKWHFSGLLGEHEDDPQNVTLVLDVLEMWNYLERGYAALSKKEKALVDKETAPYKNNPHFLGFDANNEPELFGIAYFLIKKLGRFARFKDRELNSHMPVLATYQRMLRVFQPIKAALTGDDLSPAQIAAVLHARSREQ